MPRSRKKKTPVVSKTGVELVKNYCRKCMQEKAPTDFYSATDTYLDSNGYMSICKDCIQDMFERIYTVEHSMEKTVLRLCRILNVKYDESSVDSFISTMKKSDESGRKLNYFFGIYLSRLRSGAGRGQAGSGALEDFTFIEPGTMPESPPLNEDDVGQDIIEYYEQSWGVGLNLDDYLYLEQEFGEYKRTNKCDTHPEVVLIKELCYQQNEIRKKRIAGERVSAEVKQLQDLMKNSALTPAQQNAASSGKNFETFGNFIREIEQKTPAEWYKDKEKFKDIDGIEQYCKDYIERPIKNFITGSRDFTVAELGDVANIEDINSLDDFDEDEED